MIYEVDFGIYKNFATISRALPRLKDLGTTHLELMPILKHNEETAWGYETTDYLSIHEKYGTELEFVELVQKAHALGMKVIVDMCFNHCGNTTEFNKNWFILYKGNHTNYSGCGNTFNAHNPIFIEYALQSLHKLIRLGVDGFRFDLAPLLMINSKGEYVYKNSLLSRIDEEFSNCMRIYEPWSLDGYFKSRFDITGFEWNDLLRDSVRNYLLGKIGLRKVVSEMNAYKGNINYISSHDGFSLWDMFSYDKKNNWSNGEDNRDGNSNEICGIIDEKNRINVIKKALKLVILAKGVPMLRSYDEFLATFRGNNNNYKRSEYQIMHDISNYIKGLNELKKTIDYSHKIDIVEGCKLEFICKDGGQLIIEL